MKTIHVLCTVRITNDQYSELLNSNSSFSVSSLVYETLANGKLNEITFSDPLILIPLPPTSE